jgi:hypothetical protein
MTGERIHVKVRQHDDQPGVTCPKRQECVALADVLHVLLLSEDEAMAGRIPQNRLQLIEIGERKALFVHAERFEFVPAQGEPLLGRLRLLRGPLKCDDAPGSVEPHGNGV